VQYFFTVSSESASRRVAKIERHGNRRAAFPLLVVMRVLRAVIIGEVSFKKLFRCSDILCSRESLRKISPYFNAKI
jgi:hypothetical protein